MIRRPPRSTRTDTLFPSTTLFRSQGRAAARLAAMAGGVASADSLFAATDRNDDPARPHLVAITARRDMQHWLLWAQHHGLKPNIIVPAALLLPAPATGFSRGQIGDRKSVV